MTLALWILVSTALLLGWNEALRRAPAWLGLLAFALLPVALTPRILSTPETPLFSLVKVYSVCAAGALAQGVKLATREGQPVGRLWRASVYAMMALNIAEAAVAAARAPLNLVAGLLLVLSQAWPSTVDLDEGSALRDVRYPLGAAWIGVYTLWNFAFVYGRTEMGGFAVIHLMAPLLGAVGTSASGWAQGRSYTLAAAMLVRCAMPYPPFLFRTPSWRSEAVVLLLDAASLVAACALLLSQARRAARAGQAESVGAALLLRAARARATTP